jgi:hypothetical protein
MENTLTEARREEIWYALSDAFVDCEEEYDFIVRRVADVDVAQLEGIFFNEVAPYCGPNLLTPIPPIWQGFDRDALVAGIREMLTRAQGSWFDGIRHKWFVAFCRRYFRNTWKSLSAKLE